MDMTFKSHLKGLGLAREKGWAQRPFEKVWKVVGWAGETQRFLQLERDCTWEGSVHRGVKGEQEGKRVYSLSSRPIISIL